jgi:hypothetical protein
MQIGYRTRRSSSAFNEGSALRCGKAPGPEGLQVQADGVPGVLQGLFPGGPVRDHGRKGRYTRRSTTGAPSSPLDTSYLPAPGNLESVGADY